MHYNLTLLTRWSCTCQCYFRSSVCGINCFVQTLVWRRALYSILAYIGTLWCANHDYFDVMRKACACFLAVGWTTNSSRVCPRQICFLSTSSSLCRKVSRTFRNQCLKIVDVGLHFLCLCWFVVDDFVLTEPKQISVVQFSAVSFSGVW